MNIDYSQGKNLPILKHPHPLLRTKCVDVKNPSAAEMQTLIRDMILTMKVADGIGLAAPQVGRNLNLTVIDDGTGPQVFINPKIIYKTHRKNIIEEGCLSIPRVFGTVSRPESVWVIYKDESGRLRFKRARDLLARILQHEIDHLHGVLFIDKVLALTQGADWLEQYERAS